VLTWCLGQHPNILALEETHWIARQSVDLNYLYKLGTKQKQHSSLGIMRISKKDFYQYYGQVIGSLISQNRTRIVENGTQLLESYDLLREGNYSLCRSPDDPKIRWVDGTPENSFYVYGLIRMFPDSKVIHILRNPRQVANSLMHFSTVGARDYNEEEAYLTWKRIVEACVQAEKALGEKTLRIYYDDLLLRPEFVIRSCLNFIGEPFNSDCLLPLKHKINSSIYMHNDDARLQHPVALNAIKYYETLVAELPGETNLSALRTLVKSFYEYCNKQTPQYLEELSGWASKLVNENKRMEIELKTLKDQLRAVNHPMKVISYGPKEICANNPFNLQPNGDSAIWVTTKNATSDSVIVLGDTPLASSAHPNGGVVTAIVPKHLYCQPGEFQLYLQDTSTGAESNRITLKVLTEQY